jgi:uncharacterized protein (DUF1697 family)
MAALREIATGLGLSNVQTVVASGNLVFECKSEPTAKLETKLEKAAKAELGLDTPFFVRSAKEWQACVEANPFPQAAEDDPGHLVLMPLKEKPDAKHMKTLAEAIQGRERVELVNRELYLVYPDGIGTSKLTSALIERKIATSGTARNWNTVRKLLALVEA